MRAGGVAAPPPAWTPPHSAPAACSSAAGRRYTPGQTLRGVRCRAVGGPPRSSGRCEGRLRDLIIARLLQGLLVIVAVVVVVFLVVRIIPGDPVRLMGPLATDENR